MKKALSILLAGLLLVGVAPITMAASSDGIQIGYSGNDMVGYLGDEVDLDTSVDPSNNELFYPLYIITENETEARTTIDQSGYTVTAVTRKMVKDDKLDVKMRTSSGQRVVDKVEFSYTTQKDSDGKDLPKDYDAVSVKIKFVEKFVSIKEVEYKFTVYLTQDKNRLQDTEVQFIGKYKNQETTVDENDSWVYLGDDVPVVESLAYLKAVEIELDDGIKVQTKFFNNKKYYANGEAAVRDDDDAVLSQYPEIDQVYNIDQVGLNNSYTTVSLDQIGKDTYVYNADLEFVGTGDQKLPFSTKYYVSATELDVEAADVTEPVDDTEEPADGDNFEPDPGLGGDDVPENVNDNPGTGC